MNRPKPLGSAPSGISGGTMAAIFAGIAGAVGAAAAFGGGRSSAPRPRPVGLPVRPGGFVRPMGRPPAPPKNKAGCGCGR